MHKYTVAQTNSQHLTVSAPGGSLFTTGLLILVPLIMIILVLFVRSADKKTLELQARYPQGVKIDIAKRRTQAYSFTGVGLALFAILMWGFGYTSGSLELNRPSNAATMHVKMTAFLPSQEQTIPLSSVTGAVLDYKPNARRIRLTTNSGEDLAFPMWTSRGGQKEAVDAINAFLQRAEP